MRAGRRAVPQWGSQIYDARVTARDGTMHDTIYRKAILETT